MTPTQAHQRALEDAAKAMIDSYPSASDRTEAIILAYLASLQANGYKVTPREPTEEMFSAMDYTPYWYDGHDAFQWPPPPEQE